MHLGISYHCIFFSCFRPLPSNRKPYVFEDGDSVTGIAAWPCWLLLGEADNIRCRCQL